MLDLVERLIRSHYQAIAFPIHEYWLDVGQIEDFKEANGEFSNLFE
jgi:NDP-sugar pyrophosphorylase family protein